MDSSALIASAITAVVTQASTDAARAAYDALKKRLVERFGGKADVDAALTNLEQRPESAGRQRVLHEELDRARAGKDAEIVRMAEELLKLVQANRPGPHYEADVSGSGAVAQGDGAVAAGKGGIAVGRGNVHQGGRGARDEKEDVDDRPAAPYRKGFAHLPPEMLRTLMDAVVAGGLANREGREGLLGTINEGFAAALPRSRDDLRQIESDLRELNAVPALAGGEVPLRMWLENGRAALQMSGRVEQAVFDRALQLLEKGS